MAKKILLTGAGFSKAFNGYLCSELTAYFFNALAADVELREDLLSLKPFSRKNFETLLSDLRRKCKSDQNKITKIEAVLKGIFQKMCSEMSCGGNVVPKDSIAHFFYEFDCVFTTNQDSIQDQRQVGNSGGKKFNVDPCKGGGGDPFVATRSVISNVTPGENIKYLELHGAYDWDEAFILGDSHIDGEKKIDQIKKNDVLNSYFELFKSCLMEAESKLVIVGYGFLDEHINKAVNDGIERGLKIFIWDPGAEIYLNGRKQNIEANKIILGPDDHLIHVKDSLQKSLQGYLPKKFSLDGNDKEDVKRFLRV